MTKFFKRPLVRFFLAVVAVVGLVVIFFLIVRASPTALGYTLVATGVVTWVGLAIVQQGFHDHPAEPPRKILVKLLGEFVVKRNLWKWIKPYIKPMKGAGLRFYFLKKYLFDFLEVVTNTRNPDLHIEFPVRHGPDRRKSMIRFCGDIPFTYTPDTSTAERAYHFAVQIGGDKLVEDIFHDVQQEAVRRWFTSKDYGPMDYIEAMSLQEDALISLHSALVEAEPRDPDDYEMIPKNILVQYYFKERPTAKQARKYGENWEKVEEYLKVLPSERIEEIEDVFLLYEMQRNLHIPIPIVVKFFNDLEPTSLEKEKYGPRWEEAKKLVDKLEDDVRKEIRVFAQKAWIEIQALQIGTGSLKKPSLGIAIHGIYLKDLHPVNPEILETSERVSIEEGERASERVESDHKISMTMKTLRLVKKYGPDFFDRATQFVEMSQKGKKVKRDINEHKHVITFSGSGDSNEGSHSNLEKTILGAASIIADKGEQEKT